MLKCPSWKNRGSPFQPPRKTHLACRLSLSEPRGSRRAKEEPIRRHEAVVKGAHFAPFTTQERQLRLVLTDHHASLNNGAFFLRAGAWARRAFLPLWAHLSQSRTIDWPMTDNGVLLRHRRAARGAAAPLR